MKILKVELQNLNSLKSDSPIIIDFENEQFKDVGLYAITGSTGAGKTTILDAITIALYNSVPRFNGTKGTLVDVVSHGATDAFSRVTFENEQIIYEAYWGIRIASKSGKLLMKPQEEVSLKNLSTDLTLASQKMALKEEVIRVTQLDYSQFLRSVMLAQGEFASFLTAKGSEKGRLLEQITGEQIYKKIGQAILDRRSSEENKLREIQAKINSEDVLSEERKIELTQKDKELDAQIISYNNEIESIQTIVNWYLKSQELNLQTETLEEKSKELNADFENHKNEFELLELNQKAEPFKEIIRDFKRNEKNTLDKARQLKLLEEQLIMLKPEIEGFKELLSKQSNELQNAEKEFSEWLPKLDLITKLDGQLKNEKENIKKSKERLAELSQRIESSTTEKQKLSDDYAKTLSKIEIEEAFISKNKFLTEVDLQISKWTTDLTTLKSNKESLTENSLFVSLKEEELEKTKLQIAKNEELLKIESTEIEKVEKEIASITEQLSRNNLTDLLAEEKKLTLIESNYSQFRNLSEQYNKEVEEKVKLLVQNQTSSIDLKSVKTLIEEAKAQIETQEALVTDAEKILNLEKSIAKYKDDRNNLIKGEPCGLCGSKEHPYAENIEKIGVSKSELKLKERKDKLISLLNSKSELDKSEAKLSSSIEGLTRQINSIEKELETIESKANQLDVHFDLANLSEIKTELESLSAKKEAFSEKIKKAQKLQNRKEALSDGLKKQNQIANELKTKDATFREKYRNVNSEIEGKQKYIDDLSGICAKLEADLEIKLSRFNYEIPTSENTNIFIQSIEKDLVKYNKSQKELDALRSEIKIIESKLENCEKQLATHSTSQKEAEENLKNYETKYKQVIKERSGILALNITVVKKRGSLQALKNQWSEKVEASKTELQKLLDSKTEKEALRIENTKALKSLEDELNTLKTTFEFQVKESEFSSRHEIEKALLSKEDKIKFTQSKEAIKEKQLRLHTLKETNQKAIANLNKSKSFDTSEADSKLELKELKMKKDGFLSEKGKILEAFRKDQEIRDRNQEVYKKIERQQEKCNVWRELFKIIGNSKDALNVYVQRLTLKHLLDLANVHLFKLNKRYSLKMDEEYKIREELSFNLIDHYQTDRARLVDTSSGGEKFIISLALALGLSDLASKNVKIDSLFIDEGFGTLDKNTLETVIYTLETLQSQGKMIGIISHVENLKERIQTQIQIIKKSSGVSVVEIL